jgi:hypothetical protein
MTLSPHTIESKLNVEGRFFMVERVIISGLLVVLAVQSTACGDEVFTTERSIASVSRAPQANALRTGLLREELVLSEVITVLTTYRSVDEREYRRFHHRIGAQGTVVLESGQTFLWEIQPGYAAKVVGHHNTTFYLLHPRLLTDDREEEAGM